MEGTPLHVNKDGDNIVVSPLPTAEDCANQLSSIFISASVANSSPSSRQRITQLATSAETNPPSTSTNDVQIGSGREVFEIRISIEKCHDLRQLCASVNGNTLSSKNVWLSYRCFGTIIQSEIFAISEEATHDVDFNPMMNTFRVHSSLHVFVSHLNEKKNAIVRVYLCTEGEVLGTSFVDLRQLIVADMVQNEYVMTRNTDTTKRELHECGSSRIAVRLCIDRDPTIRDAIGASNYKPKTLVSKNTAIVTASTSSQTMTMRKSISDEGPRDDDSQSLKLLEEKENQLNAREAELSKKEKEIYQSAEKKRCEWQSWRHHQELEWHEKLRNKEAAMMRVVEERVCTLEKERLGSVESSKSDHERLDARLRKALIEVESKERHLKDIELSHQHDRKRKLSEIELREKLMKEELKHSVEIERAKVNAAVEQAVEAGKAAAAANKKVKQIESEMDQLREKHRKTPETTLMHQLAGLKGQLADGERRYEAIKSENHQVTAEKEQFRSNVHKLARALRKEREKSMAKKESNNEQVRLSYDAHEKSFVLGGGQDEIQRILSDLSKMSKIKGQGCTSPLSNHPDGNQQGLASGGGMPSHNNTNSPQPPMPSPQPSHPSSSVSHHSPNISAQTQHGHLYLGHGMDSQSLPDFDQLIK